MDNYESALLLSMEEVEIFIRAFIDAEYRCEYAKWDIHVSNEAYESYQRKAAGFMHRQAAENFSRAGVLEELLESEKERVLALKILKKRIPRTLFQIRHYRHPTLGDGLKPYVTGADLFACYVSYPNNGGRDLYFSSIFYIAETDEGLKIIYEKSFNTDKGIWYHPAVRAVVKVVKEGRHIETKKYIAPVEATSLADYNKAK